MHLTNVGLYEFGDWALLVYLYNSIFGWIQNLPSEPFRPWQNRWKVNLIDLLCHQAVVVTGHMPHRD